MSAPRYVSATQIAAEYGFTSRHWIRMAAMGRIPGVVQPSGPRGQWRFDSVAFRKWWESRARPPVHDWRPPAVDRPRLQTRGPVPERVDLKALLKQVFAEREERERVASADKERKQDAPRTKGRRRPL